MHKKEILGFLKINNSSYQTRISSKFKNRIQYKPVDPKVILSFIPGIVVDIFIKQGEVVKKGDLLMILDAMKMQNRLKCNMDGKVKYVAVKKGDKVSKGTILMELE
jgi:biotin carboxyl carrier protein